MERKHIRKEEVIDYYIFTTKTGDTSVYMDIDPSEDFRKRTFYKTHQEDLLLAKEKGKLALFDLRTNEIVDENGQKLNVEGKTIYPICSIPEGKNLLDCIQKSKGRAITQKEDFDITLRWFDLVKPKRKFEEFNNIEELYQDLERIVQEYGKTFFIKTVQKGFSSICYLIEKGRKTIFYYRPPCFSVSIETTIKDDRNLLLFEPVKILKDNNGVNREWRAFVIENSLWCLSRCYDWHIDIEDYVKEKVEEKIKEFTGIMPSSYCVDFFEYEKDGEIIFDILEFNPIPGCGVYKHNDLVF